MVMGRLPLLLLYYESTTTLATVVQYPEHRIVANSQFAC
jgi:hypothetical protein